MANICSADGDCLNSGTSLSEIISISAQVLTLYIGIRKILRAREGKEKGTHQKTFQINPQVDAQ